MGKVSFIFAYFFPWPSKSENFTEQFIIARFQQKINKREKLEGRSKTSHSVHSPSYPEVIDTS